MAGTMAAIKWHGGKSYLAPKILELMPPHTHYVEAYAGGLAVLMGKQPEGVSEVVNDLHRDLTNFWKVLQDPGTFSEFERRVQAVPFSQAEWEDAGTVLESGTSDDTIGRAIAFFVRCRQSLAGRMDSFAPLSRNRVRRGMNEQASAWLTAVDGLVSVHRRLRQVVVLCRPAVEVIKQQDGPGTLFYLDPPYLQQTRTAPDVYRHEMTESDHRELLQVLQTVEGKVMLSGYRSDLYDTKLSGWKRHEFEMKNNAAGGTSKKTMTECLWCNFSA